LRLKRGTWTKAAPFGSELLRPFSRPGRRETDVGRGGRGGFIFRHKQRGKNRSDEKVEGCPPT